MSRSPRIDGMAAEDAPFMGSLLRADDDGDAGRWCSNSTRALAIRKQQAILPRLEADGLLEAMEAAVEGRLSPDQ